MRRWMSLGTWVLAICLSATGLEAQQRIVIPHHQDKPPGPALSPQEAIAKMRVPDGFRVELVAAEPDVVNPVAMTFDDRGRIWVCESFEYPRRSPGPGRDRIRVLEDTDRDGRIDKVSIFADGLNIPSGIAVGYGGVWVANAPDILFLQDTDGDGRADRREVVVTGFGRTDTHELPNSFTWGPDGWLYGLNGVFNHSHVRYPPESPQYKPDHPGWRFTCAMFRIHPRTREFQLFAEGTSNPWGIAFDSEGSAFVSACVIDHLWHLVETGYYHRQAGAYPPYTWKIESIVDHRHQKAAYCGLEWFDSDAYPEPFRRRLYMGNIHGNCINVDELTRRGSTYLARANPDFLTGNDAWFMPVDQKTGPEGFLYILDWYDRYHCYQDANRDPEGIDRAKGRIYRICYGKSRPLPRFDLSRLDDEALIDRLGDPNVFYRRKAQRLLAERSRPETRARLKRLVLDASAGRTQRMHALWTLISMQGGLPACETEFFAGLMQQDDPGLRAWALRGAVGAEATFDMAHLARAVEAGVADPSADVRLQAFLAASKVLPQRAFFDVARETLHRAGDDAVIPRIVWRNLLRRLEDDAEAFVHMLAAEDFAQPAMSEIIPRVLAVLLDGSPEQVETAGALIGRSLDAVESRPTDTARRLARQCVAAAAQRLQTGQLDEPRRQALRTALQSKLSAVKAEGVLQHPVGVSVAVLAAALGDRQALDPLHIALLDNKRPAEERLLALSALVSANVPDLLETVDRLLSDERLAGTQFRSELLVSLGRLRDPRLADVLLARYADLEPELQPRVVELLTQRTTWSRRLLDAIAEKRIPASALNVNQVRRLLSSRDAELVEQVKQTWGTVREQRDPTREKVIGQMRELLERTPGDPVAGAAVFKRVCGQCHRIYGEGVDVGPDLTSNGRNSFEQLLSNVFDPSLVIGAAYRATTVVTDDGRVVTGILTEQTPQRVTLKVQGGKLETFARSELDELKVSKVSMMPEKLETQLKPQEIADLFAFLALDRPPGDPKARLLPGAPRGLVGTASE